MYLGYVDRKKLKFRYNDYKYSTQKNNLYIVVNGLAETKSDTGFNQFLQYVFLEFTLCN